MTLPLACGNIPQFIDLPQQGEAGTTVKLWKNFRISRYNPHIKHRNFPLGGKKPRISCHSTNMFRVSMLGQKS